VSLDDCGGVLSIILISKHTNKNTSEKEKSSHPQPHPRNKTKLPKTREQEEAAATAAYLSLDPIHRLYLLLALCEAMLDEEGEKGERPLHDAMAAIESGTYCC
jgi:hypothetical protein